ncbi:MAG: hypothetical protein EZS28_035213 [Streblomastix strix]|uniref:Uncharacterized protein n=1 Tax=Streblomastix strix TaxID=222440 RepID=A0A5J4UGS2_9EUKA|nr:MAG: hypothetical protein EZS28_035213 [Streblomastix strix]
MKGQRVTVILDTGTFYTHHFTAVIIINPNDPHCRPILFAIDNSGTSKVSFMVLAARIIEDLLHLGIIPVAFVTDGLLRQVDALKLPI